MTRTKKRLWLCAAASLFSALSTRIWTENAAALQMTAYTALVLGMLSIGFGEDQKRERFWPGVWLVLAIHSLLLSTGRGFFPVKTTFLLWPAAGVEGSVLGLLLVSVRGKWPDPARPSNDLRRRRSYSHRAGGRVGR